MKINRIELYNIGSYEGYNIFDIAGQKENGKISVIGGKNGAGKTTLFTSIKLCLYGYKESGYQAMNAYYKKAIKKLINDKAKIENRAHAYVFLDIDVFNGQDWDNYALKRSWQLEAEPFEQFEVFKNAVELTNEEKEDFDNYLLNIIPPELFDLYFFDGEQIADFFLEDTSGERIKRAFLTICGYDTFDIVYKQFKRISRESGVSSDALKAYLSADDELRNAEKILNQCTGEIDNITGELDSIDTELAALEKKYISSGGVSLEEWNKNFLDLKNEERIREEKNAWLKAAANDMVPYLILDHEIQELSNRMNVERDLERQRVLLEAIESLVPGILEEVSNTTPGFSKTAKDRVQKKLGEVIRNRSIEGNSILNLSREEYELLTRQITTLRLLDKSTVVMARKEIKASIRRSQKKRAAIEESSISNIDSFLKSKEEFLKKKELLFDKREELLRQNKELSTEVERTKAAYRLAEKELEKHLKKESISDLTARAIRFLDVLQERLFASEIVKVQALFMQKMAQLMRKEQFISKIEIDRNFGVHVYKRVPLESDKISSSILELSEEGYVKEYGHVHCNDLLSLAKCSSLKEFASTYGKSGVVFDALLEFDKSTMSKGEKQVFIMALYWAIMELCNKDVPFIIDTPFARIDTEHRSHITQYFFKELRGQVFIFSTDEEITAEHLAVIGDDLQSKFLIENVDNTKTMITANRYFGEQTDGI